MQTNTAGAVARPRPASRPWQLGVLAGLLTFAAVQAIPVDASAAPVNPVWSTVPPAELARQMQAAIQDASPGTEVGIDVIDTGTGAVVAALAADRQFYTASVVKILIALDALHGQGRQADSADPARLEQMLATSDDDIADELWSAGGGTAIVSRMIDLIGLTGTQPPDDSAEWGETRTTPADVVAVYRYLTTVVPEPDRQVILNGLRHTTRIAADGTDQSFGIPSAFPGVPTAVKQGWMMMNASTTMNTTGLVAAAADQPLRYLVVVLTTQPAGISWTTAGSALTAGLTVLNSAQSTTVAAAHVRLPASAPTGLPS
ncbi:serine hydrolase [Nocardia heshunensis]